MSPAGTPSLIQAFLREGAVCITSSRSLPEENGEGSQPALVCKTLIQIDGDVISWIARDAVPDRALLERHHRLVLERLREATEQANGGLRRASRLARTARWGSAVLLLGSNVALWSAVSEVLFDFVAIALSGAAWHFGARFIAKRLAGRALRALKAL